MPRTLNEDIHTRTNHKFTDPITKENFDQYADVWIECARELKAEFEVEGLIETAKAVQNIIDFNIQLRSYSKKAEPTTSLEDLIKEIEAPPSKPKLDEEILVDSYPMYIGYVYIIDGKITENDFDKINVGSYK